jgi:hypothetical protein
VPPDSAPLGLRIQGSDPALGDVATSPKLSRWKKKYGGLEVNEAKRLRQLEEENRRLKQIVADQALNLQVLKDLLGNKL